MWAWKTIEPNKMVALFTSTKSNDVDDDGLWLKLSHLSNKQ